MKIQIDKGTGNFANIQPDNYCSNDDFVQIKSFSPDIDMEDVKTNQAWKFKIDANGMLNYDAEKIAAKLASDNIRKRLIRYQSEVDGLTLEYVRTGNKELLEQANKLVEQIKLELPKQK